MEQRDSSHMTLPDASVDYVVTDPPYFDSVQYSDLSRYFRVWLRWFLPDEANWTFSALSSAVAQNGGDTNNYGTVLTAILKECNRVLRRPHGRLIFTYHHWRPDAWIQLTIALKAAGFRLLNSYTVHSENPISVHIRHLKALKHDSILILQPKASEASIQSVSRQQPTIDCNDSFSFCRDCAQLVRDCLDSENVDSEIDRLWRSALGN